MKLWLARHAQPQIGPGICYGASDIDAEPHHTQDAARALADVLPHGIGVTCSPLTRCRQFAAHLQVLRADLPAVIDTRLAEMDFGQWEGQRWDAIGKPALDAWAADFALHQPGGGESVAQFMARVASAFDALTVDTLWITHAGVIRAATLLAAGTREISNAGQWPVKAPGFGEYLVLDVVTS